jgi:DNA-binding SARP family transcriptional activator
MPIRLETLGGLRAYDGDVELHWLQSQRLRAALLVFIAVERKVSRASLATMFWPESDEENARHALRQNLYQLRRFLGEGWVETRTHDLRVADAIQTDLAAFDTALARGDAERAVKHYSGPFLAGIHLLDLKPWEQWVDARRAHMAREFRKASRKWVEDCLARGDTACAIEAAQRWTAPDPLDDEAQHRLIEVLAKAGRRTDAIRQYETYLRALQAEELEPLDETKALYHSVQRTPRVGSAEDAAHVAAPRTDAATTVSSSPAPRASTARWRSSRSVRRVALTAAAAVVLALTISWLVRPISNDRGVRILVLPVAARAALSESEGTHLGALHQLIIASLETITRFEIVDGARMSPGRTAVEAARRVRARYVISPQLISGGSGAQLRYTLSESRTGARVAQGIGGAGRESLDEAAKRLVLEMIGILAMKEGVRAGRAPRLHGSTTSPVALSHLVEGQARLYADDIDAAVSSFRLAVAADSSFAEAYFWLSYAESSGPLWRYPASLDVIEAGLARRDRLKQQQVDLLEAQRHYLMRQADSAIMGFERIQQIHPEVLEAWLGLGESIYHFGGYVGRTREEAQFAFEHLLSIDSLAPASVYGHVVETALHRGNEVQARKYTTLMPADEYERHWYTSALTLRFGSGRARSALLDSLSSTDSRTLAFLVIHFTRAANNLPLADTLASFLMTAGRPLEDRRRGAQYRLMIGAATGQWTAARDDWDGVSGTAVFDRWLIQAYLAGYVAPQAVKMFAWASSLADSGRIPDFTLPSQSELSQAFRATVQRAALEGDSVEVNGLLSKIDRARHAADGSDPLPAMQAASLQARLALLAHDTTAALSALERATAFVPEPYTSNFPLTTMAPQRVLLAELHARRGNWREAERWLNSFWRTSSVADVLFHERANAIRQAHFARDVPEKP